jgi:hypothetical protein
MLGSDKQSSLLCKSFNMAKKSFKSKLPVSCTRNI